MESHSSPITKSLHNLPFHHTVVYFHTYGSCIRSKSLPNIFIVSNETCLPDKGLGQGLTKKHPKPKILKKTWDKVKTVIHNTTSSHSNRRGSLRNKLDKPSGSRSSCVSSAPSTPIRKSVFEFEGNSMVNDALYNYEASGYTINAVETDSTTEIEETEKIQRNYAKLQKRLSEELHQRMSEYKPDPNKHAAENLSDDFKKRLQQWEMWKLSTGKVTYTDEELQQILPEDFSKKLHEWECIKTSGVSPHRGESSGGVGAHSSGHHSKTPDSTISGVSPLPFLASSPEAAATSGKSKLLRKKKNSETSRQKELAWLEKQLEKIESEKKRLEREMKKYNEREARLEKMKEALQNTNSNELWIRTPTAKCKVEKITEKFTKKLYEWEEKQGIQPESSTMALLHPKYFGPPPGQEEAEVEENINCQLTVDEGDEESSETRYEDDDGTPAFTFSESDVHQEECCYEPIPEICHNAGSEERQISSASSSDFEEATDSFATHDKGNSGASNTDSDFYRAEFPCSRRRSSEAISTPLSARSPSLSAFTSDDEGELCGLLKTVCEEETETLNNTLKDAESQTEVIFKAKPIHVFEDDDGNEELAADDCQTGIFVPTKRTIFTPILTDESEQEKVVLIEQESDLISPSLVNSLIRQSQADQPPPLPYEESVLGTSLISTITGICPQNADIFSPHTARNVYGIDIPTTQLQESRTPPRIVEVIPKVQQNSNTMPKQYPQPGTPTTAQRSFPKMGKVPIWCSPLGSRRYLGGSGVSTSTMGISDLSPQYVRSHSTDFTTDRFLRDSQEHEDGTFTVDSASSHCVCTSASTSRIPTITPRLYRRNTSTAVIEESGLVGANVQTGQRHPAILLPARSSSFRFRRESSEHDMTLKASNLRKQYHQQQQQVPETSTNSRGLYSQLRHRVGSVIPKSQSTGSIRSKLGKAFSSLTHKFTGDKDKTDHHPRNDPAPAVTSMSQNQQPCGSSSASSPSSSNPFETDTLLANQAGPSSSSTTLSATSAEPTISLPHANNPSTSKKHSISIWSTSAGQHKS